MVFPYASHSIYQTYFKVDDSPGKVDDFLRQGGRKSPCRWAIRSVIYKEGWESIVRYDQDFTWAAFYRIASSIEGITWEKPSKAIIVPGDAIVVDRDELLAPDEMSVDIGVEFDPRTNWPDMIIPGYVNFQTGDVCFDDDVPSVVENTDSLLSAEVILYNGERISVNLAEMQLSKE